MTVSFADEPKQKAQVVPFFISVYHYNVINETKPISGTKVRLEEESLLQDIIIDSDEDSIPDNLDNCVDVVNPGQWNLDGDEWGNKCDDDIDGDGASNFIERLAKTRIWDASSFPILTIDTDGDGIPDNLDNCINIANPGQWNLDGDEWGNKCDDDIDGDGASNFIERLAKTGIWDANSFPVLTIDTDGDGIPDNLDNCITIANSGQWNLDGDEWGNKCDDDIDGDGASNFIERLAKTRIWDASSVPPFGIDSDGDGIPDSLDNCISVINPSQWNLDDDERGNKCDQDIDGDGFDNWLERLAKTSPWDANEHPQDLDGNGSFDFMEEAAQGHYISGQCDLVFNP